MAADPRFVRGPDHDPDNILGQLEPQERADERYLREAASASGLTVDQMRRAICALDEVPVVAPLIGRVAWRERIRARAPVPEKGEG